MIRVRDEKEAIGREIGDRNRRLGLWLGEHGLMWVRVCGKMSCRMVSVVRRLPV